MLQVSSMTALVCWQCKLKLPLANADNVVRCIVFGVSSLCSAALECRVKAFIWDKCCIAAERQEPAGAVLNLCLLARGRLALNQWSPNMSSNPMSWKLMLLKEGPMTEIDAWYDSGI